MKAILKYRLEPSSAPVALTLHEEFRTVRFEYVVAERALFVWVEENLRADAKQQRYLFRVARRGEPVPSQYQYQLTALDPFGPEAYHLFRLDEESERVHALPHTKGMCVTPPDQIPRSSALFEGQTTQRTAWM